MNEDKALQNDVEYNKGVIAAVLEAIKNAVKKGVGVTFDREEHGNGYILIIKILNYEMHLVVDTGFIFLYTGKELPGRNMDKIRKAFLNGDNAGELRTKFLEIYNERPEVKLAREIYDTIEKIKQAAKERMGAKNR